MEFKMELKEELEKSFEEQLDVSEFDEEQDEGQDEELDDELDLESRRPEGFTGKIITSPLKALRQNCLDCCCGSYSEVKACAVYNCACWPFRLGKNPYRKPKKFTEEQRKAIRERLSAFKEKQ